MVVVFSAYVATRRSVDWYQTYWDGASNASVNGVTPFEPASGSERYEAVICAGAADLNVGVKFKDKVAAGKFAAGLQRLFPNKTIATKHIYGDTVVGFRDSKCRMWLMKSSMSFNPGKIVTVLRSTGLTGPVTMIIPRYLEGFVNITPVYQTPTRSFYRIDQYTYPDTVTLYSSLAAPGYIQYMLILLSLVLVGLGASVAGAWVVSKPDPDQRLFNAVFYFPVALCIIGFLRLVFFDLVMYLPAVHLWLEFDPDYGNSYTVISFAFIGIIVAFIGIAIDYQVTISSLHRESKTPENEATRHLGRFRCLLIWVVLLELAVTGVVEGTAWLPYRMVPIAFGVMWLICITAIIYIYEKMGQIRLESGAIDKEWYESTVKELNETGARLASELGVQNRPIRIGFTDEDLAQMNVRHSPNGALTFSNYLINQMSPKEIEFIIARSLLDFRRRMFLHPELARFAGVLFFIPMISMPNRNSGMNFSLYAIFVLLVITAFAMSQEMSVSKYKKVLECTGDYKTALQAMVKLTGYATRDLSDFEIEEFVVENNNTANLHKAAMELGMAQVDKYSSVSR